MFRYIRTKPEKLKSQVLNVFYEDICYYPVIHHAAIDQSRVYGERYTLGAHTHDVYHLTVYTKTAGAYLQDGQFHPAELGALVIVSPWEKHDFVTRSGQFEYSEVTFSFISHQGQSLDLSFEKLLSLYTGVEIRLKGHRQKFTVDQIGQFISILAQMIDFLESKTDLGEFNAYRSLVHLLDFIIVNTCESKDAQPLSDTPCRAAKNYIDSHYAEKISISTLAEVNCVSEGHLIKSFKKNFRTTPLTYQKDVRMEAAKTLLKCSSLTCSQVAKRIGYDNNHYFHRLFKKATGQTPKEYRSSYVFSSKENH